MKRTEIFVYTFIFLYLCVNLFYAFYSNATWDDDCPGRYYNTLNAFNNPEHFVSLWNRPLFVVIFAIPVQFGKFMIPILMTLISAGSTLLLYKALKKEAIKNAYLIVPLILFQVYFFGLSRNAETEPLAVALISLGYYFKAHKKWILFALVGGLLPLARLELCVFFPFWMYYLYREKEFRALLVMFVPLLAWNLAGAIITGDFAFLYSKTIGADNSTNRYGHTTFGHYFQRYIYVVGPVFFFFFSLGFYQALKTRLKYNLFVFVQFVFGFLIYVIFSWELNMGNAAGFLRNIAPLTSLAGIIALWGFNFWIDIIRRQAMPLITPKVTKPEFDELSDEEVHELNRKKRKEYASRKRKYEKDLFKWEKEKAVAERKNRWLTLRSYGGIIATLVFLLIITYSYFRLELRNHHVLVEDTVYNLNLYFIAGLIGLTVVLFFVRFFRKSGMTAIGFITGIVLLLFTAITEPPTNHDSKERSIMQEVSDSFQKGYLAHSDVYVNHVWFFWANDLDRFLPKYRDITMNNLDSAELGSICIWEPHYSHRLMGDVKPVYFTEHPEWHPITTFTKKGARFKCLIYEKIDTLNPSAGSHAVQRFLELYPSNSEAYIALANTYQKDTSKLDSALFYLNEGLLLDSTHVMTRFSRGMLYFKKKDMKRAESDFLKCLVDYPKWPEAWANLGATSMNLKKYDTALVAFNNAITLNQTIPSTYLNRGRLHMMRKDTVMAINDFSNVIRLSPNNINAYQARAKLYFQQKNWEATLADANRIAQMAPKNHQNWMLVGVCYLNLKKIKEAKNAFLKAQSLGNPAAAVYIRQYCTEIDL